MTMTAETLSLIVGTALSLAFSYLPGLRDWFESQSASVKQLVMGVLLMVFSVGVFALACAQLNEAVTCDKPGALGLVDVLLKALVANQATYLITRRTEPRLQ